MEEADNWLYEFGMALETPDERNNQPFISTELSNVILQYLL